MTAGKLNNDVYLRRLMAEELFLGSLKNLFFNDQIVMAVQERQEDFDSAATQETAMRFSKWKEKPAGKSVMSRLTHFKVETGDTCAQPAVKAAQIMRQMAAVIDVTAATVQLGRRTDEYGTRTSVPRAKQTLFIIITLCPHKPGFLKWASTEGG